MNVVVGLVQVGCAVLLIACAARTLAAISMNRESGHFAMVKKGYGLLALLSAGIALNLALAIGNFRTVMP